MKKLLTILSAFGLVASTSINLVACGDTSPPEIKEKTDWVKEDAIKNLGELHYEINGDEIKIVSDTFEFEAFDSPSKPEEIEWKKEIKLKNDDVKKLDTKLYGNSTIENQWNYEIMSYISLSNNGSEEDAIKDYNESLKYTKNPYLNFSENWFRGDAHHYRIYSIEQQVCDKNGDNAITVYFTTIMFDFIFGYINENIDKVMQEIIIDFEQLCKENKRDDVSLVKVQNKYILQEIKLNENLTIDGKNWDVYFILSQWFESKCYSLSEEINEFNIKKSEFDYLKETSYEVMSGLDKKETKLQLAFSKKSPIYISNFSTWHNDPEQYKYPLFINLEEEE
ncbi:lipoprotein [Spiroplasma endosymbiont of Cantharis rufa]|uniref:lipoprotein n=1 Tax=Spiroplasma endosymbiont of Cantharis rufa TaxID=3066279 RepID=UPI0030D1C9B6